MNPAANIRMVGGRARTVSVKRKLGASDVAPRTVGLPYAHAGFADRPRTTGGRNVPEQVE
jgi:hypothetical protein